MGESHELRQLPVAGSTYSYLLVEVEDLDPTSEITLRSDPTSEITFSMVL